MKVNYNSSTQLSTHFNASEFQCKCGKSHEFEVNTELLAKLELLHSNLNCSKIIVNSGYRCAAHDKNVGGSGSGQHTKGTAADIVCYDCNGKVISSKIVCCMAQDLGFTGIANIDASYTATHVDVRTVGTWYGDEVKSNNTETTNFYEYFNLTKENVYKFSTLSTKHTVEMIIDGISVYKGNI